MSGGRPRVELGLGEVMVAGGSAIGRLDDGRVVFCEGGLPGEEVTAEIVESRRDYAKLRVVEVGRPSPFRVDPPCSHVAAGCGGCGWQHATLEAQLSYKVGMVADAFRRLAHMDLPKGPAPRQVAAEGYRTTLRLAVDPDGRLALRNRGGRGTVAAAGCLVSHPALADLLAEVRLRPAPPETSHTPGRRRGQPGRRPPEVLARVSAATGERVLAPRSGAVVVEAPIDVLVAGPSDRGVLREAAGGRMWQVSAESFFQAGPAPAALLASAVDDAAGALTPGTTVVDLYAGVGLLGGVVAARTGSRLVAVESAPSAVEDARANLADLDAEVHTTTVDRWEPEDADLVIADPARTGLGRPGVAAVVATGAARLVLVSCDPASGARDVTLLQAEGYRPVALAVLDLFPHTSHVETVTTFIRP